MGGGPFLICKPLHIVVRVSLSEEGHPLEGIVGILIDCCFSMRYLTRQGSKTYRRGLPVAINVGQDTTDCSCEPGYVAERHGPVGSSKLRLYQQTGGYHHLGKDSTAVTLARVRPALATVPLLEGEGGVTMIIGADNERVLPKRIATQLPVTGSISGKLSVLYEFEVLQSSPVRSASQTLSRYKFSLFRLCLSLGRPAM